MTQKSSFVQNLNFHVKKWPEISFFIPIFDKTKEWKMLNKNISGSAKNEASEKRSSAVSKKRASVSSASSSKSKVDLMENGRGEAVKTAEKKERVPTGKASEERPPTTSGGAEENKETTENEDMRKTQSTPVILEKVIFFSLYNIKKIHLSSPKLKKIRIGYLLYR